MTPTPTWAQRRLLQERYRTLMGMSDTQLRIHNSNGNVDFKEDRVYQEAERWIKKEIEARRVNESRYTSALFHRFEDSVFDAIAGFYEDRTAARVILYPYRGRIADVDGFRAEQHSLYQRRVEMGTRHSLGILEHSLEVKFSSTGAYFPLPAPGTGRVERAPRLDELDQRSAW